MEKLNPETPDLAQAQIERLRELFPECVTEGPDGLVVDFDALRQALSNQVVEGPQERYVLDWPGKREAAAMANQPTDKTLRPARDESVDFDTTQNLFIEGDNLEALKLIQETYLGQVKMIYIDPPYNTGNDFIYRDDFKQAREDYEAESGQRNEAGERLVPNPESAGRFHSDWLSMMYPRLKLAKNLLADDGVIFISIDDGEVANLRRLCDEIFGAGNFLSEIVVITGANQSSDGVKIQKNTDLCLAFARNIESLTINRVDEVEASLRNLNDAPTPLDTRPDMGFTVYFNPQSGDLIPKHDYDKAKISSNDIALVYTDDNLLVEKGYVPIRPGKRNLKLHRWRWSMETFLERSEEVVVTENKRSGEYSLKFKQWTTATCLCTFTARSLNFHRS